MQGNHPNFNTIVKTKHFYMVLFIPGSDAEKETKCEEGEEEKPSFYWRQTREDIELWIFVAPDTSKKTVKVDLTNRSQRIVLQKFLQRLGSGST
jgi:hypothetical protein